MVKATKRDLESQTLPSKRWNWWWILLAIPIIHYYYILLTMYLEKKPKSTTQPSKTSEIVKPATKPVQEFDNLPFFQPELDQLVSKHVGCGSNWQREYRELHEKLNKLPAKHKDKRTFIFDATCCGMSDRWQSIITAFSYSLITKRLFKVRWGETGMLEQAYFFPYINITHDPITDAVDEAEVLDVDKGNTKDKTKYFHDLDLEDLGRENRVVRWTIAAGQLSNLVHNPLYTNWIRENDFKPHAIFRCFFNYLVRPRRETLELVGDQLYALGTTPKQVIHSYETNAAPAFKGKWHGMYPNSDKIQQRPLRIGIQIRMGDSVWDGETDRCKPDISILTESENSAFFACAETLEQRLAAGWNPNLKNLKDGVEPFPKDDHVRQPTQWYLLTDCAILRAIALGKIPNIGMPEAFQGLKGGSDHGDKRLQQIEKLGIKPTNDTNVPPRQVVTLLNTDSIHHIHHDLGDDDSKRFLFTAAAESWLFGLMDIALVTDWSTFGRVAFSRSRAFGSGMGSGGGHSGGSGMWKIGRGDCSLENEIPWDHVGL